MDSVEAGLREQIGALEQEIGRLRAELEKDRTKQQGEVAEQIYRAVGETIPYGIWICDPDGRCTYASQSLLDMLGVTMQQFANFGWGDSLDPDDAKRIPAAWREHIQHPDGPMWDMQHRFRGRDGQYHTVLGRGVPVRDESGRLACWAGINLDIDPLVQVQDELLISRQRYETVLRNTPVSLSTMDRDLRFTWFYNPQSGFSEQTLVGKRLDELLDPQEVARLEACKRSVLETGVGQRLEYRLSVADGTPHTFDVTLEPLRDASGNIVGLAAASFDVTERKRHEEELRLNRERFELSLRNAAITVSTQDRDLRYTWIYNPAIQLGAEKIVGKTDEELRDPQEIAELLACKREVIRTGIGQRREFTVSVGNGEFRTIDATIEPLRDQSGAVIGLASAGVDVTTIKRAQEELHFSHQRFEMALKNTDIVVFTQDRDLRYTWVYNPALGVSPADVIGQTDETLGAVQDATELSAAKRAVIESGVGQHRDFVLTGRDGAPRTFDTIMEPLHDPSGTIIGLVASSVDVTEVKRRQQQAVMDAVRAELRRQIVDQREQERLALVRDVHEGPMQTLAALNMKVDLARRSAQNGAAAELDDFRQELKEVIGELRDVLHGLPPEGRRSAWLQDAMHLYVEQFGQEHPDMEVTCRIARGIGTANRYADMALFRTLAEALRSVDTHAQASRISVTLSFTDADAVLEVWNDGVGMEVQPEPAGQVRRRHFGLSAAGQRLEALNGCLELSSQPGEGTTLTATVPLTARTG